MASEPQSISLPIFCVRCGGAVELQFSDWDGNGPLISQSWTCPYCQAQNAAGFPGRLIGVTIQSELMMA